MTRSVVSLSVLCVSLMLSGCGIPILSLNKAQRKADLDWIFAKFERNYAPMEWKKENLGVDYNQVKEECYEKNEASDDMSNDDFRALVIECINKFQDGHLSIFQNGSILDGTAKIAHLGFLARYTEVKNPKMNKVFYDRYYKPFVDEFTNILSLNRFPKQEKSVEAKSEDGAVSQESQIEVIDPLSLAQLPEEVAREMDNESTEVSKTTTPEDTTVIRDESSLQGMYVPALRVKKILPSTSEENFRLKKDDLILAINGKLVDTILEEQIEPYLNVGQEKANRHLQAKLFPIRSSLKLKLPDENESIELLIMRPGTSSLFKIKMQWLIEDLSYFLQRQSQIKAAELYKTKSQNLDENLTKEEQREAKEEKENEEHYLNVIDYNFDVPTTNDSFFKDISFLKTRFFDILTKNNTFSSQAYHNMLASFHGFQISNLYAFLESLMSGPNDKKDFKIENGLPSNSLKIDNDTFDTYIIPTQVNEKRVLGSTVGYIKVYDFQEATDKVKNFVKAISHFSQNGVDGIIIDLIDNGGGNLKTGLEMINHLTEKELVFPSQQAATNDNWYNAFKVMEAKGASDQIRYFGKRMAKNLKENHEKGLRLTEPFNVKQLVFNTLDRPKEGCSNEKGVDGFVCPTKNIKLTLLINDTCMSMCDLFASVFKDNKMGTIIGSKTKGAGGNVTEHGTSPISRFILRQTESLLIKSDGEYLENNGVVADIQMNMSYESKTKYQQVIKRAMKAIVEMRFNGQVPNDLETL